MFEPEVVEAVYRRSGSADLLREYADAAFRCKYLLGQGVVLNLKRETPFPGVEDVCRTLMANARNEAHRYFVPDEVLRELGLWKGWLSFPVERWLTLMHAPATRCIFMPTLHFTQELVDLVRQSYLARSSTALEILDEAVVGVLPTIPERCPQAVRTSALLTIGRAMEERGYRWLDFADGDHIVLIRRVGKPYLTCGLYIKRYNDGSEAEARVLSDPLMRITDHQYSPGQSVTIQYLQHFLASDHQFDGIQESSPEKLFQRTLGKLTCRLSELSAIAEWLPSYFTESTSPACPVDLAGCTEVGGHAWTAAASKNH